MSNGLIIYCIISFVNFKSKKTTWIKEAKRWLKVMKVDINLPTKELVKEVANKKKESSLEKDKSVIGDGQKNF
jgi:hypothetical protein